MQRWRAWALSARVSRPCSHWGTSGTDWNHLRRALSACLSTYIGTDRFPYRQIVIDRIPNLVENQRIPDITLEKLGEIVANMTETVRLFAWFIVLSGCRIGEYLRLERRPLEPTTHAIDIPGTKTSGARRTVYVDPAAWCIVDAAVPCYLQYGQLRRVWLIACAQAGVSGVTPHDLRHLCGQSAADAGMPLSAIKDHLGHATIAMAERCFGGCSKRARRCWVTTSARTLSRREPRSGVRHDDPQPSVAQPPSLGLQNCYG